VNALLMAILYYANDKHDQIYDITTQYGSWVRIPNTTDADPKFNIITKEASLFQLSLNWLIFTFHILSFLFQLGALIPSYRYEERIDNEGRNPLRFIEYSLSASIMLLCIALLTGIRDFITLLSIMFFCALTQIIGLVGEYQLPGRNRKIGHGMAWFSILVSYGIILWYYFAALVNNDVAPPAFVHVIILFQVFLFMSFGFVQLIQFYGQTWCCIGAVGRQAEISYCVLSIVAKTLLGWMIYVNVIINSDQAKI